MDTTTYSGYYRTTPSQFAISFANSATCASAYDFGLAKSSVTVSGTLYNDINGLSDALVNGTAFDNPGGITMYAYLIDASTGIISFKDTLDSGNGTFTFPKANANTGYTLLLSTVNSAVGTAGPSVELPSKWGSVGENYGTGNSAGSGNEAGTPNSSISVTTAASNVTGIKFGIQKPDAGPDKSSCLFFGVNTVTMAATTTPGTWTAQYDNPGTATITNSTSATTTITNFSDGGTYRFIWFNGVTRDTAAVVITEPYAGADSAVCGASIGTLTGSYASGAWTARSGNPAGATLNSTVNGVATVNFTPVATGSYYYIYTVNTCPDTVKITVTPKPTAASATSTLFECATATGYVGTLTTSNPSPNSGAWSIASGPGTITSPTAYISDITGLSKTGVPTIARWVITDSYTCHDTATTTLSPPSMDTSMISKYSNLFCITCPVINGNTYSYFDLNGKLLASVTDSNDAVSIGQTVFCGKLTYPVAGDPAVSHVPSLDTWLLGVGHLPQPYLPRAWNLNTTNDAPMTVRLYFTDAEVAAMQGATLNNGNYYYFQYAPELYVAAYPNNSDTFIPAGAPNGLVIKPQFSRVGGYWQVAFRMPQSATFYLYPSYYMNSPLPVELIVFEATPLDKVIQLNWATASELNNMRFDIERSTDGINFEKIGEVAGKGNYKGTSNYSFDDTHAVAGEIYYYRLKQVDLNGGSTYSKIRSAILNPDDKLMISQFMPNPARNNTAINILSDGVLDMHVRIITLEGRLVKDDTYPVKKGESKINLDIKLLPRGIYMVVFNSSQGTEIRKLVLSE